MAHFSHAYLQRIIHNEILDGGYDLIVEGGLGVNTARYEYFREHGYRGKYVAIDRDTDLQARITVPRETTFITGDCFDPELLTTILQKSHKPLFFTHSALCDCLLADKYQDTEQAVDILTRFYLVQFHMRPIVSGVEIYHPRMHINGDGSNESSQRFQRFVELSADRGWQTEVVAKNLILMKRI